MHIGLFGGTFDPVHLGHLLLAEQAREQLSLDQVWFVPAAVPPHKLDQPITDGKHRRAMLEYALAGNPAFRVEPYELEHPGPSYTVETLGALTERHSGTGWSLLLGADSIRDYPTWREPERIAAMAKLVAVNRGGAPPSEFAAWCRRAGSDVTLVTMPACEIAASDLRQRVAAGRSIRYLVPRAVEIYIRQQGLYRSA